MVPLPSYLLIGPNPFQFGSNPENSTGTALVKITSNLDIVKSNEIGISSFYSSLQLCISQLSTCVFLENSHLLVPVTYCDSVVFLYLFLSFLHRFSSLFLTPLNVGTP